MSINVKRLNEKYSQEGEEKALYVANIAFSLELTTKERYLRYSGSCPRYYLRFEIKNNTIQENKVSFFNKDELHRNKTRIYYILFNDALYEVSLSPSDSEYSLEELAILIKEKIYKENKKFEQIKKQIELYEKFETKQKTERREPIPEDVKFEVWRRDGGKCVICGSQKNLEFDHIIPFSKGGSSTARNLQLLCQDCNRHKSDKI